MEVIPWQMTTALNWARKVGRSAAAISTRHVEVSSPTYQPYYAREAFPPPTFASYSLFDLKTSQIYGLAI